MGKVELLLIALGLSADAFAVAVTNGLCNKDMKPKWTLFIALTFGVYQGAMPCLGYALGQTFAKHITAYDHYIALVLLGIIGGKMVYEALKEMGNDCCQLKEISFGTLMVQGVATSIDALAVRCKLLSDGCENSQCFHIYCIGNICMQFCRCNYR